MKKRRKDRVPLLPFNDYFLREKTNDNIIAIYKIKRHTMQEHDDTYTHLDNAEHPDRLFARHMMNS
jgi:hypothetical protein